MLPKQNRLTDKYEFNKTRYIANKNNTKTSSPLTHIFYIKPHNYTGPTKFGIVVTNKFDKSAAHRNRTKRLFREAIKSNLDKIQDGYWVVVHPKFKSKESTYEEINTDFTKVLQNLPFTR